MAFGGFNRGANEAPMAEINMIPLIDVMLVLLVIFIITAPLLTQSVKIDLPRAASRPNLTRPENIQLGIREDRSLYWNGEPVEMAALARRMSGAARLEPQPELHIRADASARYQVIAEIMAAAARAGLTKIGFVSDPNAAGATR
ncbi:MAG: biopolymer transporter ExbD [Burkholderiales bacterium]|nr:biopolymer transporter ExbD [Burkholderiales bacterium]